MASQPAATSNDRVFTTEELWEYNGTNGKPIYVAVRDVTCFETTVFDMSSAAQFYGPGGPYDLFAGKDASYGLAIGSLDPNDVVGSTDNLGPREIQALMDWYSKYKSKYPKVGVMKREKKAAPAQQQPPPASSASETERVHKVPEGTHPLGNEAAAHSHATQAAKDEKFPGQGHTLGSS
mmetsp:Transcript_3248/g.5675  ORF Transcript_3248/g.5675 Transcript_3248/m.5675 type:complete len:179 (+) Transcript_3248:147-683(+)